MQHVACTLTDLLGLVTPVRSTSLLSTSLCGSTPPADELHPLVVVYADEPPLSLCPLNSCLLQLHIKILPTLQSCISSGLPSVGPETLVSPSKSLVAGVHLIQVDALPILISSPWTIIVPDMHFDLTER